LANGRNGYALSFGASCHVNRFRLHRLRATDAQDAKSVADDLTDRQCQCNAGVLERGIVHQHAFGIVVAVERCGEVLQVERDQVRRKVTRGGLNDFRELAELGGQRQFVRAVEA